jgi:hypothetical protein
MEQPPEIKMEVAFLPRNLRAEFMRLWEDCLRTRSYGIEYRMDYGRALSRLRVFFQTYDKENYLAHFEAACVKQEIDPLQARNRIAMALTWDLVREYLDGQGLSVRMPVLESHVEALFGIEDPGPLWAQYYQEATQQQVPITANAIRQWVENHKALPVQAEEVLQTGEGGSASGAGGEQGEITFEEVQEVPQGTQEAVGATVTSSSPPLTQTPGEGPVFKHPPEVLKAIEKIVKACSGSDKENEANWRRILSDPVKIKFEQILAWANEDEENILKIARLIHGDFNAGLRTAIRIVKRTIDGRTTLSHLENYCLAQGGRWEHIDGEFRILVTKLTTL